MKKPNPGFELAHFLGLLSDIGWSERELGRQVGRTRGIIRQWITGVSKMPDEVRVWLADLAEYHRQRPAPKILPRPPGRPSTEVSDQSGSHS